MKRILALSVFALVLGSSSALAICQFDECPQSERYWRNGDYGVFPNNNGSLSITLYDGGTPVATSLTDSFGSEMLGLGFKPVSATKMDLYDNGQYIMQVDSEDQGSLQAFSAYILSTRPNGQGFFGRIKEWAQSGASQASNSATAATAVAVGTAVGGVFEGSYTTIGAGLYMAWNSYGNQLLVCMT